MLLAREFVTYLSRKLVAKLSPHVIEVSSPASVSELIGNLITEELTVEDRLNDEVRDLLEQYSDYMRETGIQYSEMFRRIKNQMVQQRKVVRASGRDTGDGMKLSRDKITEMSHKLIVALKKSRECRLRKEANDVRLEIVRGITDLLQVEEKADRDARDRVRRMKREVAEGTEDYDLEYRRAYAEELKKLGIDLAR